MNERMERYFEALRGKRVAVLGLGVSNRPLVRLLLAHGAQVLGCDMAQRDQLEPEVLELEQQGLQLQLGPDYLENVTADVVFRTPGLHPNRLQLVDMRRRGMVMTSEMEAFFQVCPCTIIAVTGSDGKTTTTTLIAEILKRAGRTVWVGGNIGQPLLPKAGEMRPADVAVVELSSFQLMDMEHSPKVAVLTNLAPNHLDVHKDMAEYVAAKENIYLHQNAGDTVVLNRDNEITHSFVPKAKGAVLEFSRRTRPERCVYLEDGVICRCGETPKKNLEQTQIFLPGIHNVENLTRTFVMWPGTSAAWSIALSWYGSRTA